MYLPSLQNDEIPLYPIHSSWLINAHQLILNKQLQAFLFAASAIRLGCCQCSPCFPMILIKRIFNRDYWKFFNEFFVQSSQSFKAATSIPITTFPLYPAFSIAVSIRYKPSLLSRIFGAKPPSSPTAVASKPNLALITFLRLWYTSVPIFMASVKEHAPIYKNFITGRQNHKFLHSQLIACMRTTIDNIESWNSCADWSGTGLPRKMFVHYSACLNFE
ncbi:hypothetical protein AGLY_013168 [Aphis glycines]|uniref:Uncharacterized protein n=1 Tax=Aphis glycines TaxID=307491 RepID=A0A6G0T5W5_APHGL|nr:hypothetical protein AGLY_013168 [Aphis glycines]